MAPRGWALLPVRFAVNAPESGSTAGSSGSASRMNKPVGGDFAHISRFLQFPSTCRGFAARVLTAPSCAGFGKWRSVLIGAHWAQP
jgi:hypothetical protein